MKNYLQTILMFAVVFGCASFSFAQVEAPMVGGYRKADTTDAQIVSAANFAVKAQAKKQKSKIRIIAVSDAEQQVVAGMNYKLCLQVETVEKNRKTAVPQTIQTIVFRDLKQKYELKSWAIADCADETPPEKPIK